MARKSKAREPERTGSSRADAADDSTRNEYDVLDAPGEGEDGLLAEGEPVGRWSDDEDEEPNAFDAAGEDEEEEEEAYEEDEGSPAGYQASSDRSRKPR